MKDKILKWLGFALAIAFATLWLSTCSNLKSKVNSLTQDVNLWQATYDSCVNAKIYRDTVHDTVDRILGYVEVPVEREVIRYDTVWIEGEPIKLPVHSYYDTLFTKDFSLYWEIDAIGLKKVRFPYYRLFKSTIVESNVIEKPVPVYSYKDNSHLWFYFNLNTNFDKGLSGFSGGFDYFSKNGWGVGVGYLYINKVSFMEAGVKLRIL